MSLVLDNQELLTLKQAFYKIFKGTNPFEEIFNGNIEERLILFPIDGMYLDAFQFNAVNEASQAVEDTKMYISEIEVEEGINSDCFYFPKNKEMPHPAHKVFDSPFSYDEYISSSIILESALYSPTGKWGVMLSHEEHAVVGGSTTFIKKFKQSYPNWEEGRTKFIEKCNYHVTRYNAELKWLPTFINQITD